MKLILEVRLLESELESCETAVELVDHVRELFRTQSLGSQMPDCYAKLQNWKLETEAL